MAWPNRALHLTPAGFAAGADERGRSAREEEGVMFADYPSRLQPVAWPVLGTLLVAGVAVGLAWLALRRLGPPGRGVAAARVLRRIAVGLQVAAFFGLIPLFLLAVFVQGGTAVNAERVRAPGQYLLVGAGGAVREVSLGEFAFSWVVGYGCVVGVLLAATFGSWLRWYTAGAGVAPGVAPNAEPGATADGGA
jgi:hypothetical protein